MGEPGSNVPYIPPAMRDLVPYSYLQEGVSAVSFPYGVGWTSGAKGGSIS